MAVNVSPLQQNIDVVFSNITYWIDFYQRDYKWSKDPVVRLLDDVFYKFNLEYEGKKDLDPKAEVVAAKYPWYYLNTYVTNVIDGKTYIVDGQQRLTTLSLILTKLFHLGTKYNSKLKKWIENKIVGQSGFETEFWMNHVKHKLTQQALLDNLDLKKIDTSSGITAKNMVENYIEISKYLDDQLTDQHKFETFVFYFLHRLVLINLLVDQTDVSMVFEVINDRGVRLKPYEILKGKLLGQIDKLELDKGGYNELWEEKVNGINNLYDDEVDTFFTYLLRAKFAANRKEGQRFENNYHREMFMQDVNQRFKIKHNPGGVKKFLNDDFRYFTELHYKMLKYYKDFNVNQPYVFFNGLTEMDNQFLLVLSACILNDPDEENKVREVSYHLDRAFSLLQLQGCYDSNSFNDLLYNVSREIRDGAVSDVRPAFEKYMLQEISKYRNVDATSIFNYAYFKNVGYNLNTRFKRYFFARVDGFLAENMSLKLKHDFEDLVLKTGAVNGFHIEHILSYNDENLNHFNRDEELFEQERNRLGGILLLKGKDNISSSNEPYKKKLKSYANTLYWNETLREDSYKSKLDFSNLIKRYKLDFRSMDSFGPEELEERHKLLFEISKIIWS
jgi:uncharacterized protein with ParB-like and HNH nuclease domain